jgi:hypothetical protein
VDGLGGTVGVSVAEMGVPIGVSVGVGVGVFVGRVSVKLVHAFGVTVPVCVTVAFGATVDVGVGVGNGVLGVADGAAVSVGVGVETGARVVTRTNRSRYTSSSRQARPPTMCSSSGVSTGERLTA